MQNQHKQLTMAQLDLEALPLFSGTPMWEPEPKPVKKAAQFDQGDLFEGEKKQEVDHD